MGWIVRRLTPTECERLQGFPDGWTLLDEDTKDTPRYKALGNSMAVPVMRWIGERIQAVEDEIETEGAKRCHNADTTGIAGRFECSECGWIEADEPIYCGGCGAKVVK